MCGITAFSRVEGRSSIPDSRTFLRHALRAIEPRGHHATGAAWADPLDGHPWYTKLAGPAGRIADHLDLAPKMRTAIGHTRFATKGDPSDSLNNHPIIGEGFALVHNGRVDNDDDLIGLVGYERAGQVDSEALVALLSNPAVLDARHPADLLPLVEGVAAVAWLDGSDPHVLHLARLAVRPLTIGWTRRGDLVMSSTRATLADTAKRARVAIVDIMSIAEGTYLRVEAGRVVETVRFDVSAPTAPVPDDRPAAGRTARSRQLSLVDADGIDWGNLVPRRGWR